VYAVFFFRNVPCLSDVSIPVGGAIYTLKPKNKKVKGGRGEEFAKIK
jgi:hypothetical protein